jgi:UDP-N-acetylglucosamine--N-acetylmuramyl-(pentapeptide) pyrophosphoryl-undecaprenol N-acetylglucosamine transferase
VRVLMSGGGTAGHVYPALAVAGRFSAAPDEVVFIGTPNGLEARLVPEANVEFRGLRAAGFDRAKPWTLVTSSARLAASTLTAARWLAELRPDAVVGFGGYVSIPVGLAAVLRGVPLVLHEQNSVPGMANKFLSRWARRAAVTYEESARLLAHPERVEVTGNPVRTAVLNANREAGRSALNLPLDATVLLVFGGSRGARHLNSALIALRERLLAVPGLCIVHVAGGGEVDAVRDALQAAGGDGGGRWQVVDYLSDMGSALAASDLVVARAGATSIAEITALGLPAVLVPYPYATDDHQTKNAAALVKHGAAEVIADSELDDERFGDIVVGLLSDPARRATMAAASRALGRPDAADRVERLTRDAAGARASDRDSDHTTGDSVA